MPDIKPINPNNLAGKYWLENDSYQFTSQDSLCPIVAEEMAKIIFNLPTGFAKKGESSFRLVSIQGLEGKKNLCINTEGQWQVGYIPSLYRSYPFAIRKNAQGQRIPCVDLESDRISTDSAGVALFSEDGQPSDTLNSTLKFLKRLAVAREKTNIICDALSKHELIKPLAIQASSQEQKKAIPGVFGIDEAALNALSESALKELRDCGALSVAYAQLLSTHQFSNLMKLNNLRKAAEEKGEQQPVELDLDFLHNHGNISFGDL
ncbi:MAG: SapC family protein [Pseudohongiellaceae bacterium]|nr:SapC family protein [Pseudohongiellaceae bacterium]